MSIIGTNWICPSRRLIACVRKHAVDFIVTTPGTRYTADVVYLAKYMADRRSLRSVIPKTFVKREEGVMRLNFRDVFDKEDNNVDIAYTLGFDKEAKLYFSRHPFPVADKHAPRVFRPLNTVFEFHP